MAEPQSNHAQCCPDCGQALQTLWDYPNNEVWCLRCGNRFYRVMNPAANADACGGLRVLLLDDECERREALTARFANLGYQVTPVCHPRQALEAASFRHFDVALLAGSSIDGEPEGLIPMLQWQLGSVRFLVYLEKGRTSLSEEMLLPEVLCLQTNLAELDALELALERLMEEVLGSGREVPRPHFPPALAAHS